MSVVIPAYNEATRLPLTITKVTEYLSAQAYSYEVIVVNDGSTDSTGEVICILSERCPHLRLVNTEHRGKAYALLRGMTAAQGQVVLFTDADLSAPIEQASLLLAAVAQGYDVAIGSREAPGCRRYNEPAYRHVMGRVYNLAVRRISGCQFRDTQCGFKLFTQRSARDITSRLRLYADDAPVISGPMVTGLDVEMLVIARRQKYRVREVGVEWWYSPGSKVRPIMDSYRMLKDLIRIRLNDLQGRYG